MSGQLIVLSECLFKYNSNVGLDFSNEFSLFDLD